MNGFDFETIDRSLLRPSFSRHYFDRLLPLVPRRLPANMVTLGGFGATGVLLWACLWGTLDAQALAWTTLVATQLYVVGDHLDGLHAVARKATSPLGEFLDHWLDFLSGGLLALAALTLMGPALDPWIRLGALWLYVQAFVVTYVERSEQRVLHFATVGSLEGIVILSLWLLAWLFPGGRAFMTESSLPGGLPGYWTLLGVAALGFGGTVAVAVRRMGRMPPCFQAFLVTSATVAGATALRADQVPAGVAWALLLLHGADVLARVMQPHLFSSGRGRWPDPVTPTLLALAVVVGMALPALTWVALAWSALTTVHAAAKVVGAYAEHWAWLYPELPDEGS